VYGLTLPAGPTESMRRATNSDARLSLSLSLSLSFSLSLSLSPSCLISVSALSLSRFPFLFSFSSPFYGSNYSTVNGSSVLRFGEPPHMKES